MEESSPGDVLLASDVPVEDRSWGPLLDHSQVFLYYD